MLRIARRSAAGPGFPAGPRRPDASGTLSGRLRVCGGVPPVAVVLTALALLAACGQPPEPPLTAPPEAPGVGSAAASAPPPSGVIPGLPTALPTAGIPTYPTAGVPTYPTATTPPTTITTAPTTSGPSPAPRCANGPSRQQVLTAVKGRPGVPATDLKVIDGPFCSGKWQFTIVQIAEADADTPAEPLLVVTKGSPATLKVIEAGTDVCSVKVRNEAPVGIRVWACGA
ncbi:hypothetical protein [Actinoplanes sp. NPDC049118]|uniref:hypothetical protein n=1 Tax=Actinoplanes sp. NPDC049118 TaxID=3155769 RepID=UPI0033FA3C27